MHAEIGKLFERLHMSGFYPVYQHDSSTILVYQSSAREQELYRVMDKNRTFELYVGDDFQMDGSASQVMKFIKSDANVFTPNKRDWDDLDRYSREESLLEPAFKHVPTAPPKPKKVRRRVLDVDLDDDE